mmetsp:Transcript_18379/g.32872  ORF Transcript_18379/g.32872 Transcript_18379/m.32872 type:complete len:137 (-) Transcript_18379:404-814(-)
MTSNAFVSKLYRNDQNNNNQGQPAIVKKEGADTQHTAIVHATSLNYPNNQLRHSRWTIPLRLLSNLIIIINLPVGSGGGSPGRRLSLGGMGTWLHSILARLRLIRLLLLIHGLTAILLLGHSILLLRVHLRLMPLT